jgi:hypothetical protein
MTKMEDTITDKLSAEILKILKEESDPWNEATSKDLRYQFYNISEIEYAVEQGIISFLLDLREGIEGLNKNETETNSK